MRFLRKLRGPRLTTRLAVVLGALGAGAVAVYVLTDRLDAWMPNVATDAWAIGITVAVVDRIVRRERAGEARSRVHQALWQVRGELFRVNYAALWDYTLWHGASYERPPREIEAVLEHFVKGLETRDRPLPDDPHLLNATEGLARTLVEQVERHERVLDHKLVTSAYTFAQTERLVRNQYLDPTGPPHRDLDRWKSNALRLAAGAVARIHKDFRPFFRDALGDPGVELVEEDIDFYANQMRQTNT